MDKNKDQKLLTGAIIFASIAISGSLVFFATQLSGTNGNLQDEISKGIEAFVQEQKEAAQPAAKIENVNEDNDAYIGDKNAPITIVEFSDYQCPFCRKFYNDTLPALKEKYIDTGKVKLVYRDFPLNFHKDAIPAAAAAECVRQQTDNLTYFAFHDKIYDEQNKSGSGTVNIPDENLIQFATELNVNIDKFNECRSSEKTLAEINSDLQEGAQYGVTGTPAFFINGTRLEGAQPFEAFEQIIENELSSI